MVAFVLAYVGTHQLIVLFGMGLAVPLLRGLFREVGAGICRFPCPHDTL